MKFASQWIGGIRVMAIFVAWFFSGYVVAGLAAIVPSVVIHQFTRYDLHATLLQMIALFAIIFVPLAIGRSSLAKPPKISN